MVILASQSPRRKELLQMIVPKFSIEPSHFEEKAVQERIPERLVRLLAEGKAKTVWEKHPEDLVIGCDTIVLSPDRSANDPHGPFQIFALKILNRKRLVEKIPLCIGATKGF